MLICSKIENDTMANIDVGKVFNVTENSEKLEFSSLLVELQIRKTFVKVLGILC